MSAKTPYTYIVLRYVHDIATGEFLNVGVALLAPEKRYVNAVCRTSFHRLKLAFPSLDGDSFRSAMRHVTHSFERFQQELLDELALRSDCSDVTAFAHAVLGPDDSSLQWSQMGSGVTTDPERALEQLYERLVMAYESKSVVHRRQDEDVWKRFSHVLQRRQVLKHFTPKTISVQDDQLEFKHAWKNGVWHCLAPVSFDLASPDSIRDKAHKWLGQIASVAGANEPFKLYFLVGEPTQSELRAAFESALSILSKAPVDREVISEADADALSDKLAAEVEAHLRSSVDG